jgi:hypothetical protein
MVLSHVIFSDLLPSRDSFFAEMRKGKKRKKNMKSIMYRIA